MATILVTLGLGAFALAAPVSAQITSLIAPGPLAKAHASLQGLRHCQECHEPGREVAPSRCLKCHEPIAARIRARKGVHREADRGCVSCHPDHKGADFDIRRLDSARFDHAKETDFPLEGRHAPLVQECSRCHKTRSFLGLTTDCATCHADRHKPSLGSDCATCHTTSVAFKDTRRSFDHSRAAFKLEGSHRTVACERCHIKQVYKGVAFASCASCHRTPHRQVLGDTCTTCHTPEAWKTTRIDHARTAFPLRGRHAQVDCAKCHQKPPKQVRLRFARCADCHTDPHRGEFKQDCAACHNESGFAGAGFDHRTTKFPLDGQHARQPCAACHKGAAAPRGRPVPISARLVDFKGLTPACASCHKEPHHNELGAACESCHSTSTFKVPSYAHPREPAFFTGAHADVPCAACHTASGARPLGELRRTDTPIDQWALKTLSFACASCHADPHLGQVGAACETCHTTTGVKFQVAGWDHARTRFPLTGKHAPLECAKCHKSETGTFPAGPGTAVRLKGLGTTCAACHQDPHLGQMGAQCDACHTSSTFSLPNYRHKANPDFFIGAHATQPCTACHKSDTGTFPAGRGTAVRYSGLLARGCVTCHTDPHRGAMGSAECQTCHTTPTQWMTVSRAFHKVTLLPLEGRHLTVDCVQCHTNGVVKGTPTRCYDCHWLRRQDDRYRTRLGTQCEQCHHPTSWLAVTWNHAAMTGVQLSPVHRALGCEGCHKGAVFQGTASGCDTCHLADYQRTTNPAHPSAGFPTTCDLCHRPSHATWSQATFTHSTFGLIGPHATQPCAACHANGVYRGTPRDCVGCHLTTYQRTTNPNHPAAGFPTTCETCHSPSSPVWTASFSHNTFTLLGVHATQPCTACHKNSVYRGTSRDCAGCHLTTYQRTTNPNHPAAGFPTTCESCHSPSAPNWSSNFSHGSIFALVGVHATQACTACHGNNVYRGTPRDCAGCHLATYQRTTNPNHGAAGFPTTCESCHSPSAPNWTSSFNHGSVFALVGVHATRPCTACHVNNVYRGTSRTCVGCHLTTYQRTTNPNHAAAGFPTTCESCHSPSAPNWASSFNHGSIFALVGVHATRPCTACHGNNVYRGTSRTCVGCHLTIYQRTTNPNHAATGFPTTCDSCHRPTDSSWQQGTFNHTRFPIASGRHAGHPCSACHTNPGNFQVFSCLGCHSRSSTDSEHRGRAGYIYDSNACYSCHPQGRG